MSSRTEGEAASARPSSVLAPDSTQHVGTGVQPSRYLSTGRKLAREPLMHFLIAGALLLGVSALLRPPDTRQERISVSAAKIQQLRETWTRQWGDPPDAAQMRRLVEDFVQEEVFYREAIASGLDRDDTIVRRRLAQKVEFLAQGVAAAVEPTDSDLLRFFERYRQQYVVPAQVAFTHVYFSEFHRGIGAERAARDALVSVRAGKLSSASVSALGDTFMLQHDYPPETRDELRSLFGETFAARIFELPPGSWEGPIRSSYGIHLVRVSQAVPARVPDLEDVRAQVTMDFKAQHVRQVTDAYYEHVRKRYRVDVDEEALGTVQ